MPPLTFIEPGCGRPEDVSGRLFRVWRESVAVLRDAPGRADARQMPLFPPETP
ncbi:hypothetical protein [Albidovulum inexpectatum]|uniref:hypothetical protein n=1 Tax=Albidovulum inexpectatum TaxID=196587 RepID=UPI00147271DB|nr:hypothetical protein [Albidovulum inexpectatum]